MPPSIRLEKEGKGRSSQQVGMVAMGITMEEEEEEDMDTTTGGNRLLQRVCKQGIMVEEVSMDTAMVAVVNVNSNTAVHQQQQQQEAITMAEEPRQKEAACKSRSRCCKA